MIPNLIVKGGSKTLNIPKINNPSVLIGKVQLINDDKTITIDTNTTPINPNGVTFANTGQQLTFSNGTNTVTGTISIDNSPTNDTTGRNLYFNLTSGVIPSGTNNYTLDNATLIKLGIKSTTNNPVNPNDIYYNLINNLILAPEGLTFDTYSHINFANPIPRGLDDGKGIYILDGKTTDPTGLSTNKKTLYWRYFGNTTATTGMTHFPKQHNVGVWITDNGETKKVKFTTDSTGKLIGTKTGKITLKDNTYIFGDFNDDGNFSLGLQNWDLKIREKIEIKILHFDSSLDPLIASENQAFGRDKFDLLIDKLNPMDYYKVDASDPTLIVDYNGEQNLKIPRTINKKISLGKVQLLNASEVEKSFLPNTFSFYKRKDGIEFKANDGSIIKGEVDINGSSADDEKGRELILNIPDNQLIESGKTYSKWAFMIDIGVPAGAGLDENVYPINNTLHLTLEDSFIVDYNVNDLDFGAAIVNNEAYNEAKTTLNLTLADDIINPSLSYAIKTSPTTINNYYTNFKLHPNGVETTGDFVTTDIWLGNEIKDSNNTQKRSIDINGKIKDISNANVTTNSVPYQNTIELIIKIQ